LRSKRFLHDFYAALPNLAGFGYFPDVKKSVVIVGLALLVGLPRVFAQQNSDDQYIAIYNQMQQAETLESAGQPRQALAGYTQARADLEKFQTAFPDWNQKIVSFRLDYLAQKISGLTAQIPEIPHGATPPAAAPTNAAPNATPPPGADLQAQLNALQAQVQNLQSANEMLQAKLKEALSEQPATADAQELAGAQGQARALMKENDLLRASIKTGETNGIASLELLKVQQELAETNQKLAEATSRAERLALENQTLQARLQPLTTSPDSMEALRNENAMLKERVAGLEAAETNVIGTSGADVELARAQAKIAALQSDADVNWLEKAALENRLRQSQSAPATSAPPESGEELNTLRARLAVDEAQSVPYTPEELALFKSSAPSPGVAGTGAKPVSELPNGSALMVAEAQNYFSEKQYDKAETDYQKILDGDPNNALALANLAAIEMEENKLADAELHIKAALAQSPHDAYNLSIFGYLKFRQEKFDDALDALSRAAMLDPQNPQIQNYLGVTLSHKGLRAQAETALRKAIELDPNYGAAHNNLAVIYLNEQPPLVELARWHYQKALDDGQPPNPDLEKLLAEKGAPVNPQ
jgi:tetratricopeptide (TPR) repeat protein